MRILHVHLSEEFAGSERYCAGLAAQQAAFGHQVLVVVKDSSVLKRWRSEAAPAQVVALPRVVPAVLQKWAVFKVIRGFEPDVVHTHLGRANIRGGAAAKKARVPWVSTIHLRWKDKEMAGCDGAICIANWQKAEISSQFRGLVEVVWNWVRGFGGDAEHARALRGAWGCGENTMVFGSVGRLHKQKGMDLLVKAFAEAFHEGENVRLVLVGDGADANEIKALTDDSRVVFAGYQEDVESYYSGFDVYVSAARYEPFGLTIVEAMKAGKPLICTKTEGPTEFLRDYPVRWAEKGEIASLAAALRAEFRAGQREVGYDMRPFDIRHATQQIVDFYERVRARRC